LVGALMLADSVSLSVPAGDLVQAHVAQVLLVAG
jgi:hypothetical protein